MKGSPESRCGQRCKAEVVAWKSAGSHDQKEMQTLTHGKEDYLSWNKRVQSEVDDLRKALAYQMETEVLDKYEVEEGGRWRSRGTRQ